MSTFTTRPTLTGTFGMVSSTHWTASSCAMAVLEGGGNAFDAAVAAGFVLHVVEPHLNGPGGDLPAIVATAADPRPRVLAGQGPAPVAASAAHYRGLGLDLVPGAGPLAAVVPGAVDAWLLLLRDHGTRSLREVLSYAIDYAGAGHPISDRAAATIGAVADLFRDDWHSSAAQWLPGGRVPRAGEMVRLTEWAATLEALVRAGETAGGTREEQVEAARAHWRGPVAAALGAFSARPHRDSSGSRHAGVLTAADIAGWSATWEEPVVADWQGFSVAKTGPWGSGPLLLQTLRLLDAAGAGGVPDPSTADGVHLTAECLKLAFADREAWYADSPTVPMTDLLSPAYAAQRAALVGDRASAEFRPGSPGGREPRTSALARAGFAGAEVRDPGGEAPRGELAGTGGEPTVSGSGEPTVSGSGEPTVSGSGEPTVSGSGEPTVSASGVTRGDTVHVDVADRWGNIVSATPSGGWLQSSPTVPGLGFCLGSRLQMTWLDDDSVSVLTPGRRPRTTLSPTLVSRDGVPVLACGTPGGDQQDQWQLLFLLRHLGAGMGLQAAVDAPMWHSTSFPGSFHPRGATPAGLDVESRLGSDVVADLRARGHDVTVTGPWTLGRMCVVARDPGTGVLSGAANPRGMQGYAVGR